MSMHDFVVLTYIVAAFLVFAGTLGWLSRHR